MINRKGFTLVEIMIVVAIIALLAAIAIPNLLRARLAANESAAIAALKTVASAAHTYRAANPGYPADLGALCYESGSSVCNMTAGPGYIDSVLGGGTKQGYNFTLVGTDSDGTNYQGFTATAIPVSNNTGNRRFFVDTSGVIRYNATATADINSNPLE